jgi:nitrite reductase (NADH) small subunit
MSEWTPICRVQDIPVLGARRVARAQGAAVALFRAADDHVFALLDRCPHKGGPLSQGIVFGHSVACPLHNWTIGLADGCARALERWADAACCCDVIVLDQDGVVQAEAMIDAAAKTNRAFLERAEARRRLARAGDLRVRANRFCDEFRCQSGDARERADEVEHDALGHLERLALRDGV